METIIKVDNLKCGGCASTIKKHLTEINGIENVSVQPEASEVHIVYNSVGSLDLAKIELKHLGYPESGTTEGIEKITDNLKSYVSCAIGKLNNDQTD